MAQKVRFIATSDWQIGMPLRYMPQEGRARFAQARIDIINKIGLLAKEKDVEFIVVAGDIFDFNQLDRRTLRRTLEAMSDCLVDFYLLPGNHDCLEPGSIYHSFDILNGLPNNVKIIESSKTIFKHKDKVEIVGAPWTSKRPGQDLVGLALDKLAKKQLPYRIFLGHGGIDKLPTGNRSLDIISYKNVAAALKNKMIDMMILGDRHSTTQVGDTGLVWYCGAPEPTAFDEVDPGNVLLVDMMDNKIKVDKISVASWKYIFKDFNLNNSQDIVNLENYLTNLPNKSKTLVKLGLKGQLSLACEIELNEVLERVGASFASLRRSKSRSHLLIASSDADFANLELSGFLNSAKNELIEKAKTLDNQVAQKALSILLQMAREQK